MSVISDASTVYSEKDVTIFSHNELVKESIEVETLLVNKGQSVYIANRDLFVGGSKIKENYAMSNSSTLRVYFITKGFLKDDYKYHTELDDPKSGLHNTLLLMSERTSKNLSLKLQRFTIRVISDNWKNSEDIVNQITSFQDYLEQISHSSDRRIASVSVPADQESFDLDEEYKTKQLKFNSLTKLSQSKTAFILAASPLQIEKKSDLTKILKFPWIKVFDFDYRSRVNGFLSATETCLKDSYYSISDLIDEPVNLQHNTINWTFVNGYCDTAAMLKYTEPSKLSKKKLQTTIFKHMNKVADYCINRFIPINILLWYSNSEELAESLGHYLQGVEYVLNVHDLPVNWVLCMDDTFEFTGKVAEVIKTHEMEDFVIKVPLHVLCNWFSESTPTDAKRNSDTKKHSIPTFSDEGKTERIDIEHRDVAWIEVYLKMATSNLGYIDKDREDGVKLHGKEYLKGGQLLWNVVRSGNYVINRTIMEEKKKHIIENYISCGKSKIVKIFHYPGSGGTTFGKCLLWELRNITPCFELTSSNAKYEEIFERLKFIRDKTHLPLVLLIDGEDHHDIQSFSNYCRDIRLVILHVCRVTKGLNKKKKKQRLSAQISIEESKSLEKVLEPYADADKREKLHKFTEEIDNNEKHYMYEYGLTVFQKDFLGVRKFVGGFLQLKVNVKIDPWQKIITLLSLANYYGHIGLPCNIFHKMLKKPDSDVVTVDDIPFQGQQFFHEDNNGNWKITHYIVAQEILEQVLGGRFNEKNFFSESGNLSPKAKEQLGKWAEEFINLIKIEDKSRNIPQHINDIVINMFIMRSSENEYEKYAKLVEEIKDSSKKEKVFTLLIDSFPKNPELLAHMGRFYTHEKRFDEAENYFEKALSTRKQATSKQSHDRGDDVLHRIHCMYGFSKKSQMQKEMGDRGLTKLNYDVLIRDKSTTLCKKINNIIKNAKKAILEFSKCRDSYYAAGQPTLPYIGELNTRLHVVELTTKIMEHNNEKTFSELKNPKYLVQYHELADFAEESFTKCDELIVDCMTYPCNKITFALEKIMNAFNFFYKSNENVLKAWVGQDETISSIKLHLTVLKHKYMKTKKIPTEFNIYEDVCDQKNLMQMIKLQEKLLYIAKNEKRETPPEISHVMDDFLKCIRHKMVDEKYTLTKVLSFIEDWEKIKPRRSLATFYSYVLNVMLTLTSVGPKMINKYEEISEKLRSSVTTDRTIPLIVAERTSEFIGKIGNRQDFTILINHTKIKERINTPNFQEFARKYLEVFSGTISVCKVWHGFILLDKCRSIRVFFVPQRFNMVGSYHASQRERVEFYIGFNPKHGAEALLVTPLKKIVCDNCSNSNEVSTLVPGKKKCSLCGLEFNKLST